ncbi:MAG: hypothetical protein HY842_18860 [Bacteroidetes bacterium]|nr:hypothetical protein [Bacteroidota bacterium]
MKKPAKVKKYTNPVWEWWQSLKIFFNGSTTQSCVNRISRLAGFNLAILLSKQDSPKKVTKVTLPGGILYQLYGMENGRKTKRIDTP